MFYFILVPYNIEAMFYKTCSINNKPKEILFSKALFYNTELVNFELYSLEPYNSLHLEPGNSKHFRSGLWVLGHLAEATLAEIWVLHNPTILSHPLTVFKF